MKIFRKLITIEERNKYAFIPQSATHLVSFREKIKGDVYDSPVEAIVPNQLKYFAKKFLKSLPQRGALPEDGD
jgi:hypothetical protein